MKKLSLDDLKQFRDSQRIPISDADLEHDPYLPPYYHPGEDDPALQYMRERRRALGGPLPSRRVTAKPLVLPGDKVYEILRKGSGKQEVATTMAFVRLLRELIKDKEIGARFVPIIPDEARTFGMDSMFPTQKIYNPHGQQYTSVDAELMLAYRESEQGQLLHEGINEAGSMGSFTAAGTSYATHGEPMIPVYVFYSMFGFQRTGDSIWAAADQMARGFLVGRHRRAHHAHRGGAAAQRRALAAAGLDQPGGAGLRPGVLLRDRAHRGAPGCTGCTAWAPRTADGELAGENVFYYLTVYNEPYVQPAEPDGPRRGRPAARDLPLRRLAARRRAAGAAAGLRGVGAVGAARPATCWPSSGASAPRSGR